jgi:putative acetyltransferase
VIVRPEGADDYIAVAGVVESAFGSHVEARLVADLRASPGYVPELALVADDGEVVGHVMFTVTELEEGPELLMLSPLAVRPDRQRQGIGSQLVEEGLRGCRERGEPLVIVEGAPLYYSRFGFVRASELGIERPHQKIPEQAFQALPLPSYDERIRGRVVYPPLFDGL